MMCLATLLTTRPLVLQVSLFNPQEALGPIFVPRSLQPLGAFIRLQLTDFRSTIVHETSLVKFAPKLHPSRPESYVALEPGYIYGAVFECPIPELSPGDYRLKIRYSNLEFQGYPGGEIGKQQCDTSLNFTMS